MRKIKFRGKIARGYVYGDLVVWGGYVEERISSWDNGVIYDADEIVQYICDDANRKEVYETDALEVDFDGLKNFITGATSQ